MDTTDFATNVQWKFERCCTSKQKAHKYDLPSDTNCNATTGTAGLNTTFN